jgi:hypothetical protein
MAGWYAENGTSVSATERLRSALPRRRRPPEQASAPAPEPEQSLHEDRLRLVTDYIGAYPEDRDERIECNRTLHAVEPPLKQAS